MILVNEDKVIKGLPDVGVKERERQKERLDQCYTFILHTHCAMCHRSDDFSVSLLDVKFRSTEGVVL